MKYWDLTSIIKGPTRFERLYTIGVSSIPLSVEALRLAVQEAKTGNSVQRYIIAQRALAVAAPDDAEAKLDQEWLDETRKRVERKTIKLETELKGYKNNLIKESIRVCLYSIHCLGQTTNMNRWAMRI